MKRFGKIPRHEAVGGDDGIGGLAVQPAVDGSAPGQTTIPPGTHQRKAETLLHQRPQHERFAPVAVDHVGPEGTHQIAHAAPQLHNRCGRLAVEGQLYGGEPHFLRLQKRRRADKSGHEGFMPRFLQALRKRYAVPCGGVVPADVDDLYAAHDKSAYASNSMEAKTCASLRAKEMRAASLGL